MTANRNETCAERISDHMAGRAETIHALQVADDDCEWSYKGEDDGLHWYDCIIHPSGQGLGDAPTEGEPFFPCDRWHTDEDGNYLGADDGVGLERLDELPLSVEIVRHVRILFGTGGPADWLDAELDTDGAVLRLSYTFQDWFDVATVAVEKDSPLWRYAESVAEMMADMYTGPAESELTR